jgi:diadenylate cyclase
VVSEETGNLSICHRGKIERGFKPDQFEKRLSELLLKGDQANGEVQTELSERPS